MSRRMTLKQLYGPRSTKLSDVTERVCTCNPPDLQLLGPTSDQRGEVVRCRKCQLIDRVLYEDFESLDPVQISVPLRHPKHKSRGTEHGGWR